MQRCLVTGASGFVGHALCVDLARRGHSVVAGYRVVPDGGVPRDAIVVGEINENTAWANVLKGIDVVFHTAARVHVMDRTAGNMYAEFWRVNVAGTERLAMAAAAAGVKRLVYLSSIKVNGEATTPPHRFLETDQPKPQDAYAVSKYEAEQTLYRVAQETGLEIVIIRPPLIYGPGVKGNLGTLLAIVNKSIPLPLGSVSNRRDFISIGNLLDAMVLCSMHPNAANQTYLVSDGQPLSTPALIRYITKALGRGGVVFKFPVALLSLMAMLLGRSGTADRLLGSLEVDSSKMRRELDWIAPLNLEEGFRRMVAKD